MATKITTAVFALIMGFSFSSFAGTPETKGEAKPEAKTNNDPPVYHYKSESTVEGQFRNTANWAEGPSSSTSCGIGTTKPCEITAEDETELAAMLSGKDNAGVLAISDNKRN